VKLQKSRVAGKRLIKIQKHLLIINK